MLSSSITAVEILAACWLLVNLYDAKARRRCVASALSWADGFDWLRKTLAGFIWDAAVRFWAKEDLSAAWLWRESVWIVTEFNRGRRVRRETLQRLLVTRGGNECR